VVVDINLLQTPQGVASGGRDEVLRYGGLAEYTLNVDTQKLGFWPGGFLRVQGMSSFGQNVNNGLPVVNEKKTTLRGYFRVEG
jgi:porin